MSKQPQAPEPALLWHELEELKTHIINNLVGELCTLMDSMMDNERQVKAAKDMVKSILWASEDRLRKTLEVTLNNFSKRNNVKVFPDWLEDVLRQEGR